VPYVIFNEDLRKPRKRPEIAARKWVYALRAWAPFSLSSSLLLPLETLPPAESDAMEIDEPVPAPAHSKVDQWLRVADIVIHRRPRLRAFLQHYLDRLWLVPPLPPADADPMPPETDAPHALYLRARWTTPGELVRQCQRLAAADAGLLTLLHVYTRQGERVTCAGRAPLIEQWCRDPVGQTLGALLAGPPPGLAPADLPNSSFLPMPVSIAAPSLLDDADTLDAAPLPPVDRIWATGQPMGENAAAPAADEYFWSMVNRTQQRDAVDAAFLTLGLKPGAPDDGAPPMACRGCRIRDATTVALPCRDVLFCDACAAAHRATDMARVCLVCRLADVDIVPLDAAD
jgi:hypothetical protein